MAGHDHDHDHDHDHEHGSELSETQLRVRALETILTEKGYIDPAALDAIIEAYETKIGPRNGARVVAKAWTDPAFKQALLDDATKAVASLGHVSRVGDHLVAVENTPQRHNMIVCTLCSCYPWEVLGLPPVWYKSAPYRSRAVKDPRGVLADFGVTLPKDTEIRVWDSTAETRFLVLPMRPAGTEGWSEEKLADLVTRDSMIGTGLPKKPERGRLMDGVHDMGGMDGFGKVEPEPNEPLFHAPWEGRVLAMQRAMGYAGAWTHRPVALRAGEAAAARSISPRPITSAGRWRWRAMLIERGYRRRRRARRPAMRCGRASRCQRKLTADDVERGADARLVRPASSKARRASSRATACAPRTSIRATHTRLPRYARGKVGVVERVPRLPRVSGHGRDRPGRESAMALHRGVRRPRIVGRRTPIRRSRSRSMRSSRIWSRRDMTRSTPPPRAAPPRRCPSIPCDAEGPVFREPWEAQAFAMALALLRARPVHLAGMGGDARRRDQAAQAAGDPDTGETYYRHWLAALERLVAEKGVTDARHARALSRRLGPRRRPHAARQADRTAGRKISR